MKYLYLLVTDDEYELPIIVCDTVKELANKMGVSSKSISQGLYRYYKGRYKKSKYRKVLVE